MGRGIAPPLRLIHDRKKRAQTFEKRRKSLEKKAHELSTLCDVDLSMIMFGPDDVSEGTNVPAIWPEDPNVTSRLISMFENQNNVNNGNKNSDIGSYYRYRIGHVGKEVEKLKKQNMKDTCPVWLESFNTLSSDQLLELGNELDNVLHGLKSIIGSVTTEQEFQGSSSSGNRGKELEVYHPCQGLNSFNHFGNELYESSNYSVEPRQVFEPIYGNMGNELVNYQPLPGVNSFNCYGDIGAVAVDNSQTMNNIGESSSYYNTYNNSYEKAIVPASFDHMSTNTDYYCSSSGVIMNQSSAAYYNNYNNNNENAIVPASFDHMSANIDYYCSSSGVINNQPPAEYTWHAQPQQVFMPCPLSSVDPSQMVHGGTADQWTENFNFQL